MNKSNNGGPAFPQPVAFNPNGEAVTAGKYFDEAIGMSLRDWLAGQALAGSLASQTPESHWVFQALPNDRHNDLGALEGIATLCYDLADTMLATRNKQPKKL